MSGVFEVQAPGKIVLVGEYAVLDGAPALVSAINRGVRCAVRLGPEPPTWSTPDGDDRFVRQALIGAPGGVYTFLDWNPVAGIAGKPGFGGSAAACVAACVAAGHSGERAIALHREAQGSGSGVDVAAAWLGGTVRFVAGEASPAPAICPVVIWSGASAKTGPRVARYLALAGRSAFVRASAALVDAFYTDPIAAFAEAGDQLCAMADSAGLDYLTPAHATIRAVARELGGAAKPSGAGGGDCAVALLPDPEAEAAFCARLAALGLPRIPVALAPGAHRVFSG